MPHPDMTKAPVHCAGAFFVQGNRLDCPSTLPASEDRRPPMGGDGDRHSAVSPARA